MNHLQRKTTARAIVAALIMLVAGLAQVQTAQAEDPPNHQSSWNNNGQMNFPADSVIDSKGNIYLPNIPNNSIQKYTKEGTFVKSWGGFGVAEGKFDRPEGIGIDDQDNVYVADFGNHRIQKFSSDGVLIDVVGSQGNGNGQFNFPRDVSIGNAGQIFVVDSGNDRIQRLASNGDFLSKWGTAGQGNGQFMEATSIANDSVGNVFVADLLQDRIQKFDPTGNFVVKWGSKGTGAGQFDNPTGLVVDAQDGIYVADSNNDRVQKFGNSGQFVFQFGSSGNGPSDLKHPEGVSLAGNAVYVSDTFHHRVQIFVFDPKPEDPKPEDPKPPVIPPPDGGVFDPETGRLHIRLKCPKRFRPFCHTTAMPMTKKRGGKPMAAKPAHRKLRPDHWTVVTFKIMPKYRAKVKRMSKRDVKLLHVTQTIRSKRIRDRRVKRPSKVFHIYKVRTAKK